MSQNQKSVTPAIPQFLCFYRTPEGRMLEQWTDGLYELSEYGKCGRAPLPLSRRAYAMEQRRRRAEYVEQQERQAAEFNDRVKALNRSGA